MTNKLSLMMAAVLAASVMSLVGCKKEEVLDASPTATMPAPSGPPPQRYNKPMPTKVGAPTPSAGMSAPPSGGG